MFALLLLSYCCCCAPRRDDSSSSSSSSSCSSSGSNSSGSNCTRNSIVGQEKIADNHFQAMSDERSLWHTDIPLAQEEAVAHSPSEPDENPQGSSPPAVHRRRRRRTNGGPSASSAAAGATESASRCLQSWQYRCFQVAPVVAPALPTNIALHAGLAVSLLSRRASSAPSVAYLAQLAGFLRAPQQYDWFCTKGGLSSVVCVEYSDKAPHGDRFGELAEGIWFQALEVAVVLIPACRSRPMEWGIAVRCPSKLVIGRDAWVNVTRRRVRFAYHYRW